MLRGLRALLIDMDGVVYRGDEPLPGAQDLVPTLQRLGIRFCFVTNNATLTPQQFQAKLANMAIKVDADRIVTSPEATAHYLQGIAEPGTPVLVVGEHGLVHALEEAGFVVSRNQPAFVVVGLDRQLTYERLAAACLAIQDGAQLVATNADPAIPVPQGMFPGAGALLAAIVTATGATPTIIGKPAPTLLQVALERIGSRPEEAAMVGDQLGTDIAAGRAAGMSTILVEGTPGRPVPGVEPDLQVRNLAHLLELLLAAEIEPSSR
jgi:4-nitrophenyl phosphatase